MICPCCIGQNVVEFVEKYKISSSAWTSITYKSIDFFHSPRFCKDCGHIFNSSPPSLKNMKSYYIDQIPQIVEDYDVSKRISIFEEINHDSTKKRLLDFGGNSYLNFHSKLEKKGYSVTIMDIDDSYNEMECDVIFCYFVFEHLIDFDAVLSHFKDCLAVGGKIIIEVPNALLYDKVCLGLMCEHQQHFQNSSLKALMARFGFQEIFTSNELCSRDYGFVSVFQEGISPNYSFPIDVSVKEKYIAGRAKQLSINEYISEFFNKQLKQKKILFFWGANANLEQIFESKSLKEIECIVIDMNTNKRLLVERLGYEFYAPSEFLEAYTDILGKRSISFDEASVVITATAHANTISSQLDKINCDYVTFDPISANFD